MTARVNGTRNIAVAPSDPLADLLVAAFVEV